MSLTMLKHLTIRMLYKTDVRICVAQIDVYLPTTCYRVSIYYVCSV